MSNVEMRPLQNKKMLRCESFLFQKKQPNARKIRIIYKGKIKDIITKVRYALKRNPGTDYFQRQFGFIVRQQ